MPPLRAADDTRFEAALKETRARIGRTDGRLVGGEELGAHRVRTPDRAVRTIWGLKRTSTVRVYLARHLRVDSVSVAA